MKDVMVSDEEMFKDMAPCPFCGGEPYVTTDVDENGRIWYGIACSCIWGFLHDKLDFYEARANWNKRVMPLLGVKKRGVME